MHYVFSDLHGQLSLYQQIMSHFPSDSTFYFLGDAADRGIHGYKIINRLLELVSRNMLIYLKGNHEDMLVRAAIELDDCAKAQDLTRMEYVSHFDRDVNLIMDMGVDMRIYALNGGAPTFQEWINRGCKMNFIYRLAQLPLKVSWDKYDMCHAGCTIEDWENNNENAILWDRSHFSQPWYPNRILVHGHTPVGSMDMNKRLKPYNYCNHQKWDIDTGCFQTGYISVLCLETQEYTTFCQFNM